MKIDRVRALAPTHVIVNIDENRREDVEAIAAFVPHVIVTHPLAPEDNVALYALLGGIFGCGREAARLTQRFRAARERLARATAGLPREKVLYLIWRAPWMSIGRRTYISAMLEAAGWDSLPDSGEARYPVLELTEPWLAPVQRVLLPGEPYPFRARHARELATLPALAGKPVLRIDGEMTSWYGSRAVAGMDYLARLRLQQDPGLG
ncbi:MAG: cobalamin-binding protein [Rhodocyclales bacterium CG17_big_fil_post_rev_8_21_14_2_50_68_7]|nr:MAG: cobalamin-binding protein [Rhodocyclales bacterium CG17_big_fil_post_rev_8_21_14_2_50_68_7]